MVSDDTPDDLPARIPGTADELDRRDALRAVAAAVRDAGIEVAAESTPARWAVTVIHEARMPGTDRRLRLRFRVSIGPLPEIEAELWGLLTAEEPFGRPQARALGKKVKEACFTSAAIDKAKGRVDGWLASMAERAAALGDAWRPKAFADDLMRAAAFGGRIPRLQGLLDALEETFSTAAARAGHRVRRARLEDASGLGVYLDGFATARAMVRKLRLFVGPTNSGKTHAAMDRLAEAGSGCYLAPLRLLALEGQEALESRGSPCSLMTGEERDVRPGASFVSSTIEMANTNRVWGACVIDEIQMIGDPDRGWAWTQAVAGIAAPEIVMTGSADAIPYIQRLAAALGEELEVVEFTRKSPLRIQEEKVPLKGVRRGDAVIAFSRREVMGLRHDLLAQGHTVAVIYGALSPEVRRAEARRFREGQADVLVATDAIGMGLNLPIARVVLSATRKFDGKEERDLNHSEIRQIGGRAGRFGIQEDGRVAVLDGENINPVRRALTSPPTPPADPRPWISPTLTHVEAIARELETDSLARVLRTAGQELLRAHQTFRMTDLEGRIQAAAAVDRSRLPLAVRDTLSRCPIDVRDQDQLRLLTIWAVNQGRGVPNPAPDEAERFHHHVGTDVELEKAERAVKGLTSYAWLSYRFPEAYPEMDLCQERRQRLNAFIERTLAERSLARACPACGTRLKANHRFRVCDSCYAQRLTRRPPHHRDGKGGGKDGGHRPYHHANGGTAAPGGAAGTERPAGQEPPKRGRGGRRKAPPTA
ncbi:ATP-dependent RNA helicase SUPV3L1/SUV3 [Azospirillum fermentarium]|uniref:helicase-related protein n=1 Tax=Azospirillum fermentarium TaxID=1233114 RepID=UPI0022260FB2|nr:helicase-related protein [Azospirillum fermentarium]MCW2247419.1 ATP-dependent RNA helicase SUPV3L1/SUV3 [Azospirillum fermentarium]